MYGTQMQSEAVYGYTSEGSRHATPEQGKEAALGSQITHQRAVVFRLDPKAEPLSILESDLLQFLDDMRITGAWGSEITSLKPLP